MLGLTTVIRRNDGTVSLQEGTLFRLPAELRDNSRLRQYSMIVKPGWGVCNLGYHYYARTNSDGDLMIFPGLRIVGASQPKRKFSGYALEFTRQQIEEFAIQITAHSEEAERRAQADLHMLIHDLRNLSTAIYNAAEEASRLNDQRNFHEVDRRLKNIINTQTILKIRTDLLDFAGNTSAQIEIVDVPIFQKVDKVNRCFKPLASGLGLATVLSGHSFKRSRGPNVFEIVPYILIDNALKYAAPNSPVEVEVVDGNSNIEFTVRSVGPLLREEEKLLIFDKGFRGEAAVNSGKAGSGLGLFLAAKIVREHFHGQITVSQEPAKRGIACAPTEFVVTLPAVP